MSQTQLEGFNKVITLLQLMKDAQRREANHIKKLTPNATQQEEFDSLNGGLRYMINETEKEIKSIQKNYNKLNQNMQKMMSENEKLIIIYIY